MVGSCYRLSSVRQKVWDPKCRREHGLSSTSNMTASRLDDKDTERMTASHEVKHPTLDNTADAAEDESDDTAKPNIVDRLIEELA